ncbi:MAG: hypothetical protein PHQ91_06800 [Thermoanaerobaculaceae bacterium]|nr:hypothetical protein [Thermoanaerobaculaceae bacterium]
MSDGTRTAVLRRTESTVSMDICPRCEEGILLTVEVPHDVQVAGSVIRIPNVKAEQCPNCGFRALSGREVRLFEVLFAPHYGRIADLVEALQAARYLGMFLREQETESNVAFGSREYVAALAEDLRDLYLDNESSHVIEGLAAPEGIVPLDVAGRRYRVRLPKIGEGENGVVYDYAEDSRSVFKVAKPRPYSRDHLRQECEVTEFFARQGIPVPRIVEHDRYGSFVVKERLAGKSLAVLYDALGAPSDPRHQRVREAVRAFVDRLLDLFVRHPEAKTSLSPNNIFVVEDGDACACLLVDTGPAPFHDYSRFEFGEYWDVVVPEKIARYRTVGYI